MPSRTVVVTTSEKVDAAEPLFVDITLPVNVPRSEKPSAEKAQLVLAMLTVGTDANGDVANEQIGSFKHTGTALYRSSSPNLVNEPLPGELAIVVDKDHSTATSDSESDDDSSSEDEFIPRSATPPSKAKLKSSVLNRKPSDKPSSGSPLTTVSEHMAGQAATAPPPANVQSDQRLRGTTIGTASPRARPVAPQQTCQLSAQQGPNENKSASKGGLLHRIFQGKGAAKSVSAGPSANAVSGDKTDGKETSQGNVGQQSQHLGKASGENAEDKGISA
ncbi:hypothetical protein C8Q79DRAFT_1018378 [Trametes meyenii]|nr:hypothetical protein C8Q79DRAFT_1018378 [Trametes meyenii]